MDSKDVVAEYYSKILGRLDQDASNLDETDCMVYLIVSVLRTIKAGDFYAIFEVLLDDEGLMNYVDFLEELDEPDLADSFRQAQCLIDDAGYVMSCDGTSLPESLKGQLDAIQREVTSSSGLEQLEDKLLAKIQGY